MCYVLVLHLGTLPRTTLPQVLESVHKSCIQSECNLDFGNKFMQLLDDLGNSALYARFCQVTANESVYFVADQRFCSFSEQLSLWSVHVKQSAACDFSSNILTPSTVFGYAFRVAGFAHIRSTHSRAYILVYCCGFCFPERSAKLSHSCMFTICCKI